MKTVLKREADRIVLVTRNDEGVETVLGEATPTKDGISYKLPQNELNRQWYSIKKFEGKDEAELSAHVDRTQTSSSSHWEDYLTDEEKATILSIKEKCIERRNANKPSDKEKAIAKWTKYLEKAKAELAKYNEQ